MRQLLLYAILLGYIALAAKVKFGIREIVKEPSSQYWTSRFVQQPKGIVHAMLSVLGCDCAENCNSEINLKGDKPSFCLQGGSDCWYELPPEDAGPEICCWQNCNFLLQANLTVNSEVDEIPESILNTEVELIHKAGLADVVVDHFTPIMTRVTKARKHQFRNRNKNADVTLDGKTYKFTGHTVDGTDAISSCNGDTVFIEVLGEPLLFNAKHLKYSKIHHIFWCGKLYLKGGNPDLVSAIQATKANKHCFIGPNKGEVCLFNDAIDVYSPIKIIHEGMEVKFNGKTHPLATCKQAAADSSNVKLVDAGFLKLLINIKAMVYSYCTQKKFKGKTYDWTGESINLPAARKAAVQSHWSIVTESGWRFLLNDHLNEYSHICTVTSKKKENKSKKRKAEEENGHEDEEAGKQAEEIAREGEIEKELEYNSEQIRGREKRESKEGGDDVENGNGDDDDRNNSNNDNAAKPPWFEFKSELRAARSWFCNGGGEDHFYYQLLIRLKGMSPGEWDYPHFPIEDRSILQRVFHATKDCLGCAGTNGPNDKLPKLKKVKECFLTLMKFENDRRKKRSSLSWEAFWNEYGHWLLKVISACSVALWPLVQPMFTAALRRTFGIEGGNFEGGRTSERKKNKDEVNERNQ